MESLNFKIIPISSPRFDEVISLRQKVFCIEQGFPEDLIHNKDDKDCEVFILEDQNKEIVATCRIRFKEEYAKFELLIVDKAYRGQGLGDRMIFEMKKIANQKGFTKCKLTGQARLSNYYLKHNFEIEGELFDVNGVGHYWFSTS